MKRRNRSAFTLIEILIVVAIMTILSGILFKMWSTLERGAKATNANLGFMARNEILVHRLTTAIRASESATTNEDILLALTQLQSDGTRAQIVYECVENELTRTAYRDSERLSSRKIGTLRGETIQISVREDGSVRIEITKEGRNRPLEVNRRRLVSVAYPRGDRP